MIAIGYVRYPGRAPQLITDEGIPLAGSGHYKLDEGTRRMKKSCGFVRGQNGGPWSDEEIDYLIVLLQESLAPGEAWKRYEERFGGKVRSYKGFTTKYRQVHLGRGRRKFRVDGWTKAEDAQLLSIFELVSSRALTVQAYLRQHPDRSKGAVKMRLAWLLEQ